MEGYRYADDSEPTWYTGAQYNRAGEPRGGRDGEGVHERPSGAFRLPEQRLDQYPAEPDPATTGSHARPAEAQMPAPYESGRITARGPEYPAVRPTPAPAPVAPAATPRVPKKNVPVSALVVAVVMVLLVVPVVRLLLDATFAGTPTAHAIVPAVLLTFGFALTGVGLFAVTMGGGPVTRESWLRPPTAYLPVGLILLVIAGVAAG